VIDLSVISVCGNDDDPYLCCGPARSVKLVYRSGRIPHCVANVKTIFLVVNDLDSFVGSSMRSYFLYEVDGLISNDGILTIGATNNLDQLDPSVTRRPSRFDRKYHFSLPNEDERLAYCH
jgi:transitional endoplasmic reticulum ATPase